MTSGDSVLPAFRFLVGMIVYVVYTIVFMLLFLYLINLFAGVAEGYLPYVYAGAIVAATVYIASQAMLWARQAWYTQQIKKLEKSLLEQAPKSVAKSSKA